MQYLFNIVEHNMAKKEQYSDRGTNPIWVLIMCLIYVIIVGLIVHYAPKCTENCVDDDWDSVW